MMVFRCDRWIFRVLTARGLVGVLRLFMSVSVVLKFAGGSLIAPYLGRDLLKKVPRA
jgi:hypothetical protein